MSEKRFFTKVNNKGRLVIIDSECHTELFDMTLACEVLNRLDLKLKTYNEQLGEQQATITNLQGDIERQKYIIEELRKDNYNKFELINKMKKEEKLYAKEILRLNELNKQTSEFTDILGGY